MKHRNEFIRALLQNVEAIREREIWDVDAIYTQAEQTKGMQLLRAAPELLKALKYLEESFLDHLSEEESDIVYSALTLAGESADAK